MVQALASPSTPVAVPSCSLAVLVPDAAVVPDAAAGAVVAAAAPPRGSAAVATVGAARCDPGRGR